MEGPKIFRCIQHLNEIRDLAYTIDIYEKESADKIKTPCAAFHKCYVPLKCEMEAGVITMIDKIVDLCDAVAFHHTPQFYECDDKLSARNTTCLQEWEPFPDPVADVKKTEELQKEACKNFFGKDDCLKEEISDWCGLDMWEQFRKTVYEMCLKAEILKNLKDIDGIFSKQCVELQNCYPILNCGDVEKREAADKVFNDIREESVAALNQTADSEIYKLCTKFPECIPNLKCGSEKELGAIVEKMESFCEIIVAMISKEFADCDSKLLPENSICIKEWDPFPSIKNKNVEDREKMKKIQAEACKNFFGKDNCMEKEIKERCGVEMWQKLRKRNYRKFLENHQEFIKKLVENLKKTKLPNDELCRIITQNAQTCFDYLASWDLEYPKTERSFLKVRVPDFHLHLYEALFFKNFMEQKLRALESKIEKSMEQILEGKISSLKAEVEELKNHQHKLDIQAEEILLETIENTKDLRSTTNRMAIDIEALDWKCTLLMKERLQEDTSSDSPNDLDDSNHSDSGLEAQDHEGVVEGSDDNDSIRRMEEEFQKDLATLNQINEEELRRVREQRAEMNVKVKNKRKICNF
ncbi:hypothetical protein CAEBREN_14559 [Caenorhabditis brenneri]|uniref:T20D4.11-like domain-containing protein n=1 Tax=Caenorhabditis brenneri TaxID=135651 RepID=G0MA08_CAEBE|nr:hypothetical protein CAEBREN_14559 [Caenorhabditis brenneri]